MTKSSSGGQQAQQQPASPELSSTEKLVAGVFGVDPDHIVAEQIATAPYISSEIASMATTVLTTEDLYEFREIDGTRYKVSKGNEHFANFRGQLEEAQQRREPEVAGFRLYQQVTAKKGQQAYKPVLLVMNGNLEQPIASINLGTKTVNKGHSIEPEDSVETLEGYISVVAAIMVDSMDRLAEAERIKQQEKAERRQTLRRAGRRLAAITMIGATVLGGIKIGDTIYDNLQQAEENQQAQEIEAQREQEAEERAQEQAAEEAESRREDRVQKFDGENNIASEQTIAAGEVAILSASDQFVDVSVPQLGQEDIDQKLANDISHPREIALETSEESACTVVDLTVNQGDSFKAIHDGSTEHIYTFKFDPKTDTLTICDSNMPGMPPGSEAENVVIQRLPT